MPRKKQQNPQSVKLDSEDALALEVPGSLSLDAEILLEPELKFDDSDHKILGLERFADVAAEIGFSVYPLSDEESSVCSQLNMESETDSSHNTSHDSKGDESRIVPSEPSLPPFLSCRGCEQHRQHPLAPGIDPVGPLCLRCCKARTMDFCLPFGSGISGIHSHTDSEGESNHLSNKAQLCEDKNSKVHSCHLCGFCSRYANHVKRHMKTHNGEKPFNCPLCSYASAQLVNLQRHLRIHTGEKPYKCDSCSFACSSLGNLKRHQRMHRVPPAAINNLLDFNRGQTVTEEDSVASVKVSQVPKQTPIATSEVVDYLSAFEALKRISSLPPQSPVNVTNMAAEQLNDTGSSGVREVDSGKILHSSAFPFTCRLCGVVLEDEDGTSAQICPKCTLDMLTKDSAGSPNCPGERSDKVYTCSACPFLTHYPNHLARHMKTHSGEKPYKCPQCDYASAHFDNLKRHHRVHTGEKPYKCHLCEYACGNLANLKRHQRVHSGAKPFQCTVCNYSCNQSMNLKRHMLRHSGEKPYKCQDCGYTTGHWDNYKRHQKKHGFDTDGWVKGHTSREDEEVRKDIGEGQRKVDMQYVSREEHILHSCYKPENV